MQIKWFRFKAKHRLAWLSAHYYSLRRLSFVVRHEVGGSYILRTVWPRLTQIYVDTDTDPLYSHTGYDVTSSFWSEVIAKSCRKFRLQWLWVAFLENGLSEDPQRLHVYGTISHTISLDMTSLVPSSRLQNAITMQMQNAITLVNTAQKSVRRVRPAKSWIIRSLFKIT